MTTERHLPDSGSTDDPVVDLDPETYPTVADVPGSVVDTAPIVEAIDPEEPLTEHPPGEDLQADHQAESGVDVVPSDKDLLRGGTGEQGEPRHPATDEDLLRGGSGWSETAESGDKPGD